MPHRVIPQERTCLTCKKKFKGGNYECKEKAQGDIHDVEPKQYYSPSAGAQIQWKTDRSIQDTTGGGKIITLPGKSAQFIQGMYVSTDPEEQDFMDSYPGLITFEQWEELFVPEKMRNEKRDRELANAKKVLAEVPGKDAELRRLRTELGLDPDTGQKLAG
jgi:hypothetical protein